MKLWWRIWWLILALKLVLGAWLPLTPDEAYYWVWSQHPQLSYYDHPPMVAWLMWLGHLLPVWATRWPGILLAHAGLYFWLKVFSPFLSPRLQILWLILISLMPLTGPGSLIVTPDLPLMFSWGLSLWAFQKMLKSGGDVTSALRLGAALGLGILSKYHIALIGPVLLAWWFCEKPSFRWRRWLPWTLLAMVVVATPVWLWNWQNDWASIRFQLSHGLGRPSWKTSWTYEYVLAQIALIFPTLLWLALKSQAPRYLKVAAWFPLIFFFFTSFRGYVEANWPLVAHPVIVGIGLMTTAQHLRRYIVPPLVLWASGLIFILVICALPQWPYWAAKTKLNDLRGYDVLNSKSLSLAPLYAPTYQIASLLSFRQQRSVMKLRGMNRHDFFDSLPESIPTTDHIYLVMRKSDGLPTMWQAWQKSQVIPIDEKFDIWEMQRP